MTTYSMGTIIPEAAALAIMVLRENAPTLHIYTIEQLPDDDGNKCCRIVETSANRHIATPSEFMNGVLYTCEFLHNHKREK